MKKTTGILVGLGLHPSTGGSAKSVGIFSAALKAPIVSFSSQKCMEAEGYYSENTIPALYPETGLRNFFCYPKSEQLEQANILASNSDYFSCHILYRYHAHWIQQQIRSKPRPYWVVPHGCLDPYTYYTRWWMKIPWMQFFGKKFLKEASYIIFSTNREKEKAKRWYREEQAQVIYWPLEDGAFLQPKTESKNWRASLGIPKTSRVLLFLGRLHEVKRIKELIRAHASISSQPIHLIIAGPEESISFDNCHTWIKEYEASRVHVIGPVFGEDKHALLHSVDALITISEKENFGHTVAEALAAKKPVIISPNVDIGPEISSSDCSWILPHNTHNDCVEAINDFLNTSEEKLKEMGENGFKWCNEHLRFSQFEQKINKLADLTVKNFAKNR